MGALKNLNACYRLLSSREDFWRFVRNRVSISLPLYRSIRGCLND